MLFNSVEFALFFPAVFLLYWSIFNRTLLLRNSFLLVVSYFFYAVWDWRFLSLIALSSVVDFVVGIQLGKQDKVKLRKLLLGISVFVNIGLLAFFKYFNFFADSFAKAFTLFGSEMRIANLEIILPVGISFYTFQTLSYTIDVYQRKMEPTRQPIRFFAFVSFFPQLVAGPIERAVHLLPQFDALRKPKYESIRSGLLIIAFGLIKKVVIADRIAIYIDTVYGDIPAASGFPMLLGVFFFAFQLYLDFSAYSDIAIGTAKTLGFELSPNFKRPYLAKTFSSFWSRWHISLSSWFRDYLYIPLGGNRGSQFATTKNILIVFILSGLWHGASWNFVIWGFINALFLILLDKRLEKMKIPGLVKILCVAGGWSLSLIFFRAEGFQGAMDVFSNLGLSNRDALDSFGLNSLELNLSFILIAGLMLLEVRAEKGVQVVDWILNKQWMVRYVFYLLLVAALVFYGSYGYQYEEKDFLYFQF